MMVMIARRATNPPTAPPTATLIPSTLVCGDVTGVESVFSSGLASVTFFNELYNVIEKYDLPLILYLN